MITFDKIRNNKAYDDLSDDDINIILKNLNKEKKQKKEIKKEPLTFDKIRNNKAYDDLSDDDINTILKNINKPNRNDDLVSAMQSINSAQSLGGMPTPLPFNPSLSQKFGESEIAKKTILDPSIGALKAGQEIGNLPNKLAELFGKKMPKMSDVDIDKVFNLQNKGLGDEVIQELAQFAPSFVLPEASIGKVGGALESLKGGAFAKKALESGLPQAGYFATQSENPATGFAEGLALNTALMGAGGLLDAGKSAIENKYKNLMSGLTTYDIPALEKAKELFRGSSIDLGNVLKNPTLKSFYENVLPSMSMAPQKQREDASRFILDKLKEKFSKYGLKPDELPSEDLQKMLQESFVKTKNEKNKLYKDFSEIAEKDGLKKFENTKNEINNIFPEFDAGVLIGSDANTKKSINNLLNGEPLSLGDASLLSGKINESISAYTRDPSIQSRSILAKLTKIKKSLSNEIDSHIDLSKNDELKNAYKNAKQYYGDNFSKFLDKKLYKYVNDYGLDESEKITKDFLKTQKEGNPIKELKKLTSVLPEKSKESILKDYLGATISDESPGVFSQKAKKLSKNQSKELFGKDAESVEDFLNLTDAGAYALRRLFNPETGSKLNNPFYDVAKTGLRSKGVSLLLGKKLSKKLTSDELRDKIIDKIINAKTPKLPKQKTTGNLSKGVRSEFIAQLLKDNGG